MELADFGGRRLLIGAKEAGAGSLLAALVDKWRPDPESLALVSSMAEPYFRHAPILSRVVGSEFTVDDALSLLHTSKPEVVVVGASEGVSIEKILMTACRRTGIPVLAFVDHYWNLWQRFANETTAARWSYVPDRIYVPAPACVERILSQGAPAGTVFAFEHPLLTGIAPAASQRTPMEVRAQLGVPATAVAVLFVSEYTFPRSDRWQWEQPREDDIVALLHLVLRAAQRVAERRRRPVVVLVKMHPAEQRDWAGVCAEYPDELYRIIRSFDKGDLLQVADAAFGLNSMLLLEASRSGVPAYSYHAGDSDRNTWLSTIDQRIREIASVEDAIEVIGYVG